MFSRNVLAIDPAQVASAIEASLRAQVEGVLRRKGCVVGISGGVDSAVVVTLCVRALGADRVLGLFMPDKDSSEDSLRLGHEVASGLGIATVLEEIGPALEGFGCYRRQRDAIREVFPEYGEGWRCKLSLPPVLEGARINVFQLTVARPDGTTATRRLPRNAYLGLVAATNFKQRVRKTCEYYHADRLHYAVAGTPNRLEHDQGFFVKQGDGAADLQPIAHLYKSQVYQLAAYLGVSEEIRQRPPTTETYSLPQTQEEFFFALPYDTLDLCLWAFDHQVPRPEVARALGLTEAQVEQAFRDIESKRRSARYLHLAPLRHGQAEG